MRFANGAASQSVNWTEDSIEPVLNGHDWQVRTFALTAATKHYIPGPGPG
jgi:hypothetical protein